MNAGHRYTMLLSCMINATCAYRVFVRTEDQRILVCVPDGLAIKMQYAAQYFHSFIQHNAFDLPNPVSVSPKEGFEK